VPVQEVQDAGRQGGGRQRVGCQDQLRDHTGQKANYWLVLKEIIRAAPCFFQASARLARD
jgi:hypothetical protein